jgi:predicted DCC family thiol-disulfide oxidoreductase YuxK
MEGSSAGVSAAPPAAAAAGRPYTFYYDGDCGFCTRVVRLLAAADLRRQVRWLAYQALEALPGGLGVEDFKREAYVQHAGRLEGGFYSFRRLTLVLPPLWPLAPLLWCPGMPKLGEPAYAWVARNRTRLPGSVCSVSDRGAPPDPGVESRGTPPDPR